MQARISEIVLVLVLFLIVGFARIYYGGPEEFMVVWKGEFSFQDTLVNLPATLDTPREELAKHHQDVLYQLEEMGLYGNQTDGLPRRRKPKREQATPEGTDDSGASKVDKLIRS